MPPAQRSFPSGFAGSCEFLAFDDLARAQAFQIIGLLRPPTRSRDLKATVAKNCNRDRADAAGGACHHHRPAHRGEAMALERHDRGHGGVARGPDRHDVAVAGVPRRQAGASRATGRSTIGKLIAADSRPSTIESHQTAS